MSNFDSYKGIRYTFAVRAVPSPMAYRARAILPSGARISGFGNTRPAAIESMAAIIHNYVDGREAEAMRTAGLHATGCVCNVCGNCPDCANGTSGLIGTYCLRCHRTQRP